VYVQAVDTVKPEIVSISAPVGQYNLGDKVSLTVTFSEAVSLYLKPGQSEHELPYLFLNNGGEARYVKPAPGSAPSKVWEFEYTVGEIVDGNGVLQDIDVAGLQALNLYENDTYIVDAAGNRAVVDIGQGHGLNAGVVVDTLEPVITSFTAVDGTYGLGEVVYIRANLSEVVNVSAGSPTLTLANGGQATYVTGSGSDSLLFRYVVGKDTAEGDSADLAVTGLNANGAQIRDAAGNAMNALVTAGQNDLAATRAVHVDATAPKLTFIEPVEEAGASSDVVNDGYYKAGTTVAFDVSFDEVITVDTAGGAPVLNLSNG
jgi:hypothetical protein